MDFNFIRILLNSAVKHETRKMHGLARDIFNLACTDAYEALLSLGGVSGQTFDVRMNWAQDKTLASLSFWNRILFSTYVREAYDLAKDVFLSHRTRFVDGGEGEGRIYNKVTF